jgi:hypothetical protein
VFSPDVVYPRPAIPYQVLPDDLLHHLVDVFERDRRGEFPAALLDRLRFVTCSGCGAEHASARCPMCAVRVAPVPPAMVRGRVSAQLVSNPPTISAHENSAHHYWIDGGALYRDGRHGPCRIGEVLPNATRFWVGERFGVGYYRAGQLTVGFVFDAERVGLDDRVALPPLAGQIVDAHCAIGDDRAWLMLRESIGGRLVARCFVIARTGELLAATEQDALADGWLADASTSTAVGRHLFVATDDGIVRVEVDSGQPAVTRRFLHTAPFVDSGCRLIATAAGMFAIHPDRALRITMS